MKNNRLKRRVQMLERQMMRTFDYDLDHTDRMDAMGVDFQRIDATLMELREKQARIADMETQFALLTARNDFLDTEAERKAEQLDKLRTELEGALKARDHFGTLWYDLKNDLDDERAGRPLLAKATDRINYLEEVIKDGSNGMQVLRLLKTISNQADELSKARKDAGALRTLLEVTEDVKNRMRNELAELEAKLADVKAERDALKMSPDWIAELAQVRAERDALRDALRLARIRILEAENRWISVSQLPEPGRPVAILWRSDDEIEPIYDYGITVFHSDEDGMLHTFDGNYDNTVYFWMYLPEPPKGVGNIKGGEK
jgi:chromosome segregation ATPase